MSAPAIQALAAFLGQRLTPQTEAAFGDALAHAHATLGVEAERALQRAEAGEETALRAVLERAVVGETYFFRHPEHFAALEEAAQAAAARGKPYTSAWSVGCATGEEAYSLAMALGPYAHGKLTVVGSDISPRSLERARLGRYSTWSVRGSMRPNPGLRETAEGWEVAPEVRARVSFARVNLAREALAPPAPLPPQVDVIFCRNVLVYFTPERVSAVLARLGASLAEGGLLVVSAMDATAGVPGLVPAASGWPGLFTRAAPNKPMRPLSTPALRAAQARPPSGRTRTVDARRMADAGDLDGALAACALLGDEPEALLLAASIHAERNELDRAELLLRRLLLIRADHPGGNLHLALVAARRGAVDLVERTRSQLLRGLASAPDDAPFGYEGLTAGHVRQILAGLPRAGGA